jgi:prepilin-type N-terminal cleavage/methylation domain-containing protein
MNRKSAGFSLIEVMVTVGLMAIMALAVFTVQTYSNQSKQKATNAFQADQFRKDITSYLTNSVAWRYTLKGNSTFTCITNAADCSASKMNGPPSGDYSFISLSSLANPPGIPCVHGATCYGGFDVFNATNVDVYKSATSANAGFQFNGAGCDTGVANGQPSVGAIGFQATASGNMVVGSSPLSSQCPFRLVLWWVPICPSTTAGCYAPQINVQGYLLYAPSPNDPLSQGAPNPTTYGINLILPPNYQ